MIVFDPSSGILDIALDQKVDYRPASAAFAGNRRYIDIRKAFTGNQVWKVVCLNIDIPLDMSALRRESEFKARLTSIPIWKHAGKDFFEECDYNNGTVTWQYTLRHGIQGLQPFTNKLSLRLSPISKFIRTWEIKVNREIEPSYLRTITGFFFAAYPEQIFTNLPSSGRPKDVFVGSVYTFYLTIPLDFPQESDADKVAKKLNDDLYAYWVFFESKWDVLSAEGYTGQHLSIYYDID